MTALVEIQDYDGEKQYMVSKTESQSVSKRFQFIVSALATDLKITRHHLAGIMHAILFPALKT